MFNTCPKCGDYNVEKLIKPINNHEAYAICPHCSHPHPFLRLPLFVVTGASGVGKSTICLELTSKMKDAVVMEGDILWSDAYSLPEIGKLMNFREICLRVSKNISQNGKPVVLFGSVVPEQFESCKEHRYFSNVHYVALTCDDDVLAERLRARPSWRGFHNDEIVNQHLSFNRWFKEHANSTNPPIVLLDTTNDTVKQTADKLAEWIADQWK